MTQLIPRASFIDAIRDTFKYNYVNFRGRARRSEFWFFTLAFIIFAYVVCQILPVFFFSTFIHTAIKGQEDPKALWEGVMTIYVVLFAILVPALVPYIALAVRRLHDTGKTGWWLLLNLIPCVGIMVTTIFMIDDSEVGDNQYGPATKYIEEEDCTPTPPAHE